MARLGCGQYVGWVCALAQDIESKKLCSMTSVHVYFGSNDFMHFLSPPIPRQLEPWGYKWRIGLHLSTDTQATSSAAPHIHTPCIRHRHDFLHNLHPHRIRPSWCCCIRSSPDERRFCAADD